MTRTLPTPETEPEPETAAESRAAETEPEPGPEPEPVAEAEAVGAGGDGSDDDSGAEAEAEADAEPGARRPATALRRRAALATVLAVLLLGGGAFFYGAHQLRSTPSARNQALTDAAATTRVGGDVGEGLARIFSYTPTSADAAERSAGSVLAGRAARQYTDLFAQVRESLVEQRITLSTQAVRTGVIELDGDTARLLVFLDQVSRRDKGAATAAAAQLTVTARFQDDRWLITDIKAR
ncbi:hypothetical protein NC315_18340 [Streptomyces sp. G2]|uniref:hypothetical protein n=1 Tax=Streptomyces TaxID=1883 RepID=UPI0020300ED2|nr:hypothetical protein [Streptomyces sp. G2]MCM1947320.1 hypothetical protein [Streptomyces sp. G2]